MGKVKAEKRGQYEGKLPKKPNPNIDGLQDPGGEECGSGAPSKENLHHPCHIIRRMLFGVNYLFFGRELISDVKVYSVCFFLFLEKVV